MSVPRDIAAAYLLQSGFYGHSIYATLYMDTWRRDSAVMLLHHVVTLLLLVSSYAFRWVSAVGGHSGTPTMPKANSVVCTTAVQGTLGLECSIQGAQ